MDCIHINYSGITETPWAITITNADKTEKLNVYAVKDVEINVPCKTFVNKFHYFYCEGALTFEEGKAIINAG